MPIAHHTYSNKPWYLLNAHLETVVPFLVASVEPDLYTRERLELDDGDFLDLDWIQNGNDRLIIYSHGLEGNSQSYYVKRSAKFFTQIGWDVLAWNFRGCSGELNRTQKAYHMGETQDLSHVIAHAGKAYAQIVLMGFSIGGSMTLNYLGRIQSHDSLCGAITYSVPCDLHDSIYQLDRLFNRPYTHAFLRKINDKLLRKQQLFLHQKTTEKVFSMQELTTNVIMPAYGFSSLEEYAEAASCLTVLKNISIPTLIINALNDPLLGSKSYPMELASQHPLIHLATPKKGGHCGFITKDPNKSWMETCATSFINEHVVSISQQATG